MITMQLLFKNIRLLFIVVLIVGGVWLYKDREFQKAENIRQTENNRSVRMYDSLRFSKQTLTTEEIKEHLTYSDPELKRKLDKVGINLNRIESLVTNRHTYSDTTRRETDITPLVNAIRNSIPKEQTWIDTTKCMETSGSVLFDGSALKVIVNKREYKNKSDAVVYWERNQWKFLGIKTRLFGKKQFTSKNFDDCGESHIMKIEKKK